MLASTSESREELAFLIGEAVLSDVREHENALRASVDSQRQRCEGGCMSSRPGLLDYLRCEARKVGLVLRPQWSRRGKHAHCGQGRILRYLLPRTYVLVGNAVASCERECSVRRRDPDRPGAR